MMYPFNWRNTQQYGYQLGVIVFSALFLMGTAFADPQLADADNILRNFKRGESLPEFTLQAMADNKPFTFKPKSGKPSALMFFSVMPDFRMQRSLALLSVLNHLSIEYKNRVNIIGIFSNDEAEHQATVTAFIKKNDLKVPILDDGAMEVYKRYGVFMMPLVVVITAEGKLHEVIPYTFNIKELVDGNLKLLLGDWTMKQFQDSLNPKDEEEKSAEEKEYIRRVNYGRVMISRKMYSQAMREFNTAVQLMPDQEAAYTELGNVYLKKKEYGQAEQAFNKALAANPDSDDAIAGLALSLYGKGDIDAALPKLESAFIVQKPRLEVILALAEIHEQKGNIDKAIRLNKLAVSRLMTMYEHRWK